MSDDLDPVRQALAALDGDDFAKAFGEIMRQARSLGLRGFGGECFGAAVAINRVIFGGEGLLVAGLNKPLYDEAGHAIGHGAIHSRGVYWDADGYPKEEEEVEAYGMLDPDDSEYSELALDEGIAWGDEEAAEATILKFDSEKEWIEAFCTEVDVPALEAVLRQAIGFWVATSSPADAAAPGIL